jgi:hypothetical protein
MTTGTVTINEHVRLRQSFTEGPPVAVAPVGTLETGDPVMDAALALAVVCVRHCQPRDRRDYVYEAVNPAGQPFLGEGDSEVVRLRAALAGTDCGIEAQRAALQAAGG